MVYTMCMKQIRLPTFTCQRCGHTWYPRRELVPLRCAKCKTPYWDRVRKEATPRKVQGRLGVK